MDRIVLSGFVVVFGWNMSMEQLGCFVVLLLCRMFLVSVVLFCSFVWWWIEGAGLCLLFLSFVFVGWVVLVVLVMLMLVILPCL